MKKLFFAIIIIAAIGYIAQSAGLVKSSPPAKAASGSTREATTSNLSKTVLVGVSKNDYTEAMNFHRKGERQQLNQLISEGRAFEVDGDILVKIVNSDKVYAEVEIMEGKCKGKTGTIFNSMLFEKK